MSAPPIKVGEKVVIDNVEYQVTMHDINMDSYYMEEVGHTGYYYVRYIRQVEIDNLWNDGRLKYGPKNKVTQQGAYHNHNWKRYTGATDVDDYCDCGARKAVSWTELGENKNDNKR